MRAELAVSSLDGSNFASAYPNGQRGTYSGSKLDRPGSFCESFENRLMIPGTMSSRNAVALPEIPVTQYMSLEPFSTNELKTVRFGELRRVLGISVEDHSFGSHSLSPSHGYRGRSLNDSEQVLRRLGPRQSKSNSNVKILLLLLLLLLHFKQCIAEQT